MATVEPSAQSLAARKTLKRWLNKSLKVTMSDGRILIGVFLCVDRDCNIIVGNCTEYLTEADLAVYADTRILGLALVPGKHIVRICEDAARSDEATACGSNQPLLGHTMADYNSICGESGDSADS